MKVWVGLFILILSLNSFCAEWGNCGVGPQTALVKEQILKFENSSTKKPKMKYVGTVCSELKIDSISGWQKELNGGINPLKQVKTFEYANSAQELQKFLGKIRFMPADASAFKKDVGDYLSGSERKGIAGEQLDPILNPQIIVGAAGEKALVGFAYQTKSNQYISLFQTDDE